MTAADWSAIALGAGGIAWVNWYFFVAGRAASMRAPVMQPASGSASGAMREITIVVDGGYSPSAVRIRAGERTRLVFDRRDNASCSEEVVFPDFGVRKFLPSGKLTTIDVTAPTPGEYEFMCGMSMLRGILIAG